MAVNKHEVEQRFRRSMTTYNANAMVQKAMAVQLNRMVMSSLDYIPKNILEVGCGTGLFTEELRRSFKEDEIYINDIVEEVCCRTARLYQVISSHCLPGDIEEIPLPGRFDLIVSAATFQWLNEPKATFRRLSEHLREDGLMIFSTFGKYNLREIRLTTGGGLKYRTQEELMGLLEPYFKIEQIREEFRLMEFDDPLALLQHLKKTGVNVSGDKRMWTKGKVQEFIDEYNARFAMDGKVTLTYHPLYLVCRKKPRIMNTYGVASW